METNTTGENPKRILVVEGHPKYFVSHRLPWARAAREAGYEVHVTALKTGDGDLVRDEGFPYHDIATQDRGANPLTELRFLRRLYGLLRTVKPSLVHFITLRAVLYGIVPARVAGVPAVLNSVTGLGFLFSEDDWSVRALRWGIMQFLRVALRHPNQITTFQNPDDAAAFRSRGVVSEERTAVTPGSGVDPERFSYGEEEAVDSEGERIVMLPTRLLWHKGVGVFVEAAHQLQENGRDARFVIVGETDPENPGAVPQRQMVAWHEEGVIEWWGHQKAEQMPSVLRRAYVVCLPSYYREGVPKVLIEAASCGRPLVTTDVPGCREIVQNEENGFVVPPNNADALAEGIRSLLENRALRHEMGRSGRERVEAHFTAEQVATTIVGAYDRLLSNVSDGEPHAAAGL